MALGLVLVPLAAGVEGAALTVGQLAAHLLRPHRALGEVLHSLRGGGRQRD